MGRGEGRGRMKNKHAWRGATYTRDGLEML